MQVLLKVLCMLVPSLLSHAGIVESVGLAASCWRDMFCHITIMICWVLSLRCVSGGVYVGNLSGCQSMTPFSIGMDRCWD
jgi:hypothetical protein